MRTCSPESAPSFTRRMPRRSRPRRSWRAQTSMRSRCSPTTGWPRTTSPARSPRRCGRAALPPRRGRLRRRSATSSSPWSCGARYRTPSSAPASIIPSCSRRRPHSASRSGALDRALALVDEALAEVGHDGAARASSDAARFAAPSCSSTSAETTRAWRSSRRRSDCYRPTRRARPAPGYSARYARSLVRVDQIQRANELAERALEGGAGRRRDGGEARGSAHARSVDGLRR